MIDIFTINVIINKNKGFFVFLLLIALITDNMIIRNNLPCQSCKIPNHFLKFY